MTIEFELDDTVSDALEEMINETIPESRQRMVHQLATEVLDETAQGNPVDSGRSQAGWNAAAQSLSGGEVGIGSTNGEGTLRENHDRFTTTVAATNHVPYISFLEYGTSKMAPFSMVRQALAGVKGRVMTLFRISQ